MWDKNREFGKWGRGKEKEKTIDAKSLKNNYLLTFWCNTCLMLVLPNFLLPYFPNSPPRENLCENETVYLKYLILNKTYCNDKIIIICIS